MSARRPFAAAFLAALCVGAASLAALSCRDTSGPSLSSLNAAVLTGLLTRLDRAAATPQLQSLGTLSLPLLKAGIGVKSIDSTKLGKTMEWQPVSGTVDFTARAGAPSNALRVILYANAGSEPAYPLVEIGTADLYPYNSFTGGGPDSMSLRFVITKEGGAVVGDFTAHSHAQACQCATVEGWASDGTTRLDFVVPYNIPVNGDGYFLGDFGEFTHVGTLPGPSNTTATAAMSIVFAGDSIATSSLLKPYAGRLIGESTIRLNGQGFASMHETADSLVITGTGGRELTGAEQWAVLALIRLPADIDFYIEWPTFVIFYCGC